MACILIVDDDEALRFTLERVLAAAGHTVATAADGVEAERIFRLAPFDVILTDMVMPDREGIETVMALHREFPAVGIIVMSGGTRNSPMYLEIAMRLGAHESLAKPFSPQQLHDAINKVLARKPQGA